jgi:hypothetical protein
MLNQAREERQAKNVEAERQACEIRLRAERRVGELLRQREMAKGARGTGSNQYQQVPSDDPGAATLCELGISYQQSSDWQKLADMAAEDFEAALAAPRPTTSGILMGTIDEARSPVEDGALWLWGRLQDFERNGLLDRDPAEVLSTMLGHMETTTRRLAPVVASWLRRIAP